MLSIYYQEKNHSGGWGWGEDPERSENPMVLQFLAKAWQNPQWLPDHVGVTSIHLTLELRDHPSEFHWSPGVK